MNGPDGLPAARLPAAAGSDDGDQQLQLLAAELRADRQELGTFLEVLASKLESLLPGMTKVERRRQGLRGAVAVKRIVVSGGGQILELAAPTRGSGEIAAVRARVSGGIVLKRDSLEIDEWLSALIALVGSEVQSSSRARAALSSLLLDS